MLKQTGFFTAVLFSFIFMSGVIFAAEEKAPQTADNGSIIGTVVLPEGGARIESCRVTCRHSEMVNDRIQQIMMGRREKWHEKNFKFTNGSATFRFDNLQPREDYELYLLTDEYCTVHIGNVSVTAGSETDLEKLVLDPGYAVTGKIVDGKGKPVVSEKWNRTSVEMISTSAGVTVRSAFAGENGTFRLGGIEKGKYALKIDSSNICEKIVAVEIPGDNPVVDVGEVIVRQSGGISVLAIFTGNHNMSTEYVDSMGYEATAVDSNGKGFRGTRMANPSIFGNGSLDDSVCNSVGVYVLDLEYGIYSLHIKFYGFEAVSLMNLKVDSKSYWTSKLKVMLKPLPIVSGKVVDETGKPIKDAYVSFRKKRLNMDSTTLWTDGNGCFRLMAEPTDEGQFSIDAKEEYEQYTIKPMTVESGKNIDLGTIVMKKGKVITGVVHDESGKPIHKAYISMWKPYHLSCFTDENGKFTLKGLREGEFEIDISKSGYAEKTIKNAKPGDELRATLKLLPWIEGRIVFDGKLESFTVHYRDLNEDSAVWTTSEFSNEDGSFKLAGLKSGTYELAASSKQFTECYGGVHVVEAGAPVTGIELRPQAGGKVTIKAVNAEGLPLEDIFVQVERVDGKLSGISFDGITAVNGLVIFENISPGEWKGVACSRSPGRGIGPEDLIKAKKPISSGKYPRNRIGKFEVTLEKSDVITVVMKRGYSASITVTAPDGNPLQGAGIKLSMEFLKESVKTDKDGKAVLTNLPFDTTTGVEISFPPSGLLGSTKLSITVNSPEGEGMEYALDFSQSGSMEGKISVSNPSRFLLCVYHRRGERHVPSFRLREDRVAQEKNLGLRLRCL
jgi:hypothetical protein